MAKIHTFKGLLSQFDFYHLPKALHVAENELLSGAGAPFDKIKKDIDTALELDMRTMFEILEFDLLDSKEQICIDVKELSELESNLDRLSKDDIREAIKALRYKKFRELLAPYPKYVEILAKKFNKKVKRFDIEGGDFKVDPREYMGFCRSLVHIFRNSIDHGIEDKDEREKNKKPPEASITCEAKINGKEMILTIKDDGAGVDIDALTQKAYQQGVMTPQNPLMLIFENAVSSKDDATQISGRGIGMYIVKEELDKLGGRIAVESQRGVGTTFVFTIPLKTEIR